MMENKRIRKHAPILALLVFLGVYLGTKAFYEQSWSGWTNYSAQTLLSSEHWVKEGFVKNRFLFIPMGYSDIAQYLDEPEMRHHARGTVSGGLIGKRLYYTHYPSGYLVPYALLMKSGVEGRPWFRLLSLAFSISALVLMYLFVSAVSTPAVAFSSVLYYGASAMFLDYSDSLANQPLDDLLRFAILLASVLAVRPQAGRKLLMILIWVLYFLLSISSYDSTFFIFLWLAGLDLALYFSSGRRVSVLKWAFFASAPVLAFCLQMLQNLWYLGWRDMLLDISGTFMIRANAVPGDSFIGKHLYSLLAPSYYMTNLPVEFALGVIVALLAGYIHFRKGFGQGLPEAGLAAVLLASGSAFTLVFSFTGYFNYEGRQWAPGVSLLVGASTVLAFRLWKERGKGIFKGRGMAAGMALLLPLLLLWGAQAERTVAYARDWPNNALDVKTVGFLKKLGSLAPGEDAVIFNVSPDFAQENPQPDPLEEYYADALILNFRSTEALIRDYRWLKARSPGRFDSIIMSTERGAITEAAQALSLSGKLKTLDGRYVLKVGGQG